ncbi:ATP-binding cassette domain-containing protein [Streptomyces sp. NPDC005708]|uniref:ABC transporter ATP-binding protein n=1 Tax=Streptomyces sp. NPDC005708 TaxID=3154564 RepID=UPI0033E6CA89
MIRFESVSKRYPDGTLALDDLSFEAASGEITVLVGPSGCGKTTSLRVINRMVEPDAGRVWLKDRDTATIAAHELRRGIGYVIQQAGLFPHRTVLDNIATILLLTGRTRRQARARAAELLERVGLPAELGRRYPAQLSGGQAQRVGVARALAADPPVMLMDEPFSAVDPVVREQLQDELLRLQSDLGTTIVLVTHDIDEAIKLGDKVAVLRAGGKLAQFSTPAHLLSRPRDAFVAGFVGRDRGYRALGFAAPGALPVAKEATVRLGEPLGTAYERQHKGWVLVLDDRDVPQGWLCTLIPAKEQRSDPVTVRLLHLGGTLATTNASLREVLDAALSSPSGRGVLTHPDGRFAGTLTPSQVLARIEERAAQARATAPHHPTHPGTGATVPAAPAQRGPRP